jgi:hypothetical protein
MVHEDHHGPKRTSPKSGREEMRKRQQHNQVTRSLSQKKKTNMGPMGLMGPMCLAKPSERRGTCNQTATCFAWSKSRRHIRLIGPICPIFLIRRINGDGWFSACLCVACRQAPRRRGYRVSSAINAGE